MDYQVKNIGQTCAATGSELPPGSRCWSVLLEGEGRPQRVDFSEEAWNGPPESAIAWWQTTVPEADQKARPLDADALMDQFEQLSEDANPTQEKLRYVLALLLLQKRRLELDGSRQDETGEYLQLIGRRGEGSFEVQDQHLSPDEIAQLQSSLTHQPSSS